jgi:hypothetical protein
MAIAALVHAPLVARGQPAPAPPPQPAPPQPQPPLPPYQPPYQGPYQGPPPGYGPPPVYQPQQLGPKKITEFDENAPVPYGYTKRPRSRLGFIIGGAVTFGVSYGISVLAAAIGEDLKDAGDTDEDVSSLWIPVIGPFLQLRHTETSTGKLYVAHLGIAQALGATLLIYGVLNPKSILVRNDLLSIAPMVSNGASGLMVSGQF